MEKKEEIQTVSDLMWEAIKNLPIDMFGLPNQKVEDHVERVKMTPSEVHLKLRSSSVIASLERALPRKYELDENVEGYAVVKEASEENTTEDLTKQKTVVVEVKDE